MAQDEKHDEKHVHHNEKHHSPRHWNIDDNTEMIEAVLYKGKLDKYIATVNLRAFYMELHEVLIDNRFKDVLGTEEEKNMGNFFDGGANRGEFVENGSYMNRINDVFEKRFMWSKKPDSTVEFELHFEARHTTTYSEYGWLYFKLDLVCRRIVNKEILEGNTKKILQQGTWEFRNIFLYRNNIIPKYLNNIPIVKNNHTLKHLYLHQWYEHALEYDIGYCEHDLIPIIQNLINKYFSNNNFSQFHDMRHEGGGH